ncbi:MAG: hypothetical protein J6H31_02715 [Butyrivibrio sp.]|nr:hypothetical protein [Butyrivibrio sp.]
MIIDRNGNILDYWEFKNGRAISDTDNKFGIEFHICLPYTDEQKKLYLRKKELKKYLKDTDFRALKYADGAYTEEEYKPYKEARAAARAEINQIEDVFKEPTLTREEMDEAERLAIEKLKERKGANGTS